MLDLFNFAFEDFLKDRRQNFSEAFNGSVFADLKEEKGKELVSVEIKRFRIVLLREKTCTYQLLTNHFYFTYTLPSHGIKYH